MKLSQVIVLAALTGAPALADTVLAGSDLIHTPAAGLGSVEVTVPPLPAGFFDPTSDAFPGAVVPLMGYPLQGTPTLGPVMGYGIPGQADTIVNRLTAAPVICGGPSVTIPIDMLALHLVSVSPITVTFSGGAISVRYDVHVSLSKTGPQTLGSMVISHDNLDGGTFTSTLPVRARLVFGREAPGAPGLILATLDPHIVTLVTPPGTVGAWTHTGMGLPVATSPGGVVDHDVNSATAMVPYPATSNFVVGMKSSSLVCTASGSPQKHLTAEQEMLAKHGILPPNRPPVQHFCFGDANPAPCPCFNNSPVGSGRGCLHSQSNPAIGGALLFMNGNGSLAEDNAGGLESIVLRAIDMRQPTTCIFLQGNLPVASTFFGDRLRSIGGMLLRLGVKGAVHGKASYGALMGDLALSLRSAALGDVILPGQQRGYQTYFRDPDPAFCPNPPGNTWNVTNGVLINYAP